MPLEELDGHPESDGECGEEPREERRTLNPHLHSACPYLHRSRPHPHARSPHAAPCMPTPPQMSGADRLAWHGRSKISWKERNADGNMHLVHTWGTLTRWHCRHSLPQVCGRDGQGHGSWSKTSSCGPPCLAVGWSLPGKEQLWK